MDAQPQKNHFNKATKQWYYLGDNLFVQGKTFWKLREPFTSLSVSTGMFPQLIVQTLSFKLYALSFMLYALYFFEKILLMMAGHAFFLVCLARK